MKISQSTLGVTLSLYFDGLNHQVVNLLGGDERGFCVIRDQVVLISVICESVKL